MLGWTWVTQRCPAEKVACPQDSEAKLYIRVFIRAYTRIMEKKMETMIV